MNFRRCFSFFLPSFAYALWPLLAFSQAADEAAEGFFDLASGELCFPVRLTANDQSYDVCLSLIRTRPSYDFALASAEETASPPQNIATYDQREGLLLPVVRASDGSVYVDVHFAASVESSTSVVTFTLVGGQEVTPAAGLSVARLWNEALLEGIRHDLARPTVHARNLFHAAVAMYDAWAAYDDAASAYLLGKTVHGFTCGFEGLPASADPAADRRMAISFAAYRLLNHRFQHSPGAEETQKSFDNLMIGLGYSERFSSANYRAGNAAALGNHIAQCVIDYGLQDGANERNAYANRVYEPVNPPLIPVEAGNPAMTHPNRWQPLSFDVFRDQSGNVFTESVPPFVSPEWGLVNPFALQEEDLTIYQRDDAQWWLYHDPGPPPYLDDAASSADFKWGFQLVALWSAHLDPGDEVLWDISPASIGNIPDYPADPAFYRQFYDAMGGGDPSMGHELNPYTGEPYQPQIVPRGDYARVLAEFWADGPDSETPPGHWFLILNYIADHPLLEKRFKGEGETLADLEWDVKAYLTLGGAMHDAAISAWGIKGWYDYVRPISAIRYMAGRGQSSNPGDLSYDPEGIELIPGSIELVRAGDALAGEGQEHVGKIKLQAWRGPDFIDNPASDYAGVGWILAENWWPYQRPVFVTPPFAGYISGHSTYSSAAAEVLTLLTGDEFFPGGLGEFPAPRNEFLVFEEGPSVDLVLQWATYKDASDQTSLSRIWGGIHPPADDMPGRLIGRIIGADAFAWAEGYFNGAKGGRQP